MDADEQYFANVASLTDKKQATVTDTSMRRLLPKMNKLIRGKTKQVKNFPIPEPSRIITLNGNHAPKLIVPARN